VRVKPRREGEWRKGEGGRERARRLIADGWRLTAVGCESCMGPELLV
jgi:hypothetical protein